MTAKGKFDKKKWERLKYEIVPWIGSFISHVLHVFYVECLSMARFSKLRQQTLLPTFKDQQSQNKIICILDIAVMIL